MDISSSVTMQPPLGEMFKDIALRELEKFNEKAKEGFSENRCDDKYVGKISNLQPNVKFSYKDLNDRLHEERGACLILILESPHVDEFDEEKNAIGPANGRTGRNIRNRQYWKDIFGDDFSEYELILMNPVQYQCSLGVSLDCVRDNIFVEIWNSGGRCDFRDRLFQIAKAGDVIANCCTNGTRIKLRELVQSELDSLEADLKKIGISKPILRRTHPSSWWRGRRRNGDWKWVSNLTELSPR